MIMIRIRILSIDLNEEFNARTIYSILGKFQEQRKDTEAFRDLQ